MRMEVMMQDGKLILYNDDGTEKTLVNPLGAIHELLDEPPKEDTEVEQFIGNRHERRKQAALARKANPKEKGQNHDRRTSG